jgi:hypothetical protein
MGGRSKPGHDAFMCIFKYIKNSRRALLYGRFYSYICRMTFDTPTHPISPVITAALSRAPQIRRSKKCEKTTNNYVAEGPVSGNRKGAGARKANRNALRHGMRSARWRRHRRQVRILLQETNTLYVKLRTLNRSLAARYVKKWVRL